MAVAVPIDGHGRDHLHVHFQRRAVLGAEAHSARVLRCGAGSDVLEVSEAVQEITAHDVEIAVAVPVGNAGRRPAVGFQDAAADNRQAVRRGIARLLVGAQISGDVHLAAQRTTQPFSAAIVGVVPGPGFPVVRPVVDADDEIRKAVAVEVDVTPHVSADFVGMHVRGQGQRDRPRKSGVDKVRVFLARRQHTRLSVHEAHLGVDHAGAEPAARLEDRHLLLRARVFVDINAVVGDIFLVDDHVHPPVAVDVHRQRPRPQPGPQIDDQAGMVVLQPLEFRILRSGGIARTEKRQTGQQQAEQECRLLVHDTSPEFPAIIPSGGAARYPRQCTHRDSMSRAGVALCKAMRYLGGPASDFLPLTCFGRPPLWDAISLASLPAC